jgi:DUF1009 family protein
MINHAHAACTQQRLYSILGCILGPGVSKVSLDTREDVPTVGLATLTHFSREMNLKKLSYLF